MKARVYETDAAYTGKLVHGVQIDIYDPEFKDWEMNSFYPDDKCKPSDLLRAIQWLQTLEYNIDFNKRG